MKVFLLALALVATAVAAPQPPAVRIVGSVDANRYEFPYQISMQRTTDFITYSHHCGGSILTHNWIVSAAHCTQNAANTYKIVAGILELDENTSDRQEAFVIFIANHPDYDPPQNGVAPHDISVLQLDRSLQWSIAVQPIVYPHEDFIPRTSPILTGWGSIGMILPIMPNRLQKAEFPVVQNAECRAALEALPGDGSTPFDEWSNICSGPITGGYAACGGDSGGPWAENGVLVGIVSWGLWPCGSPGAPSVYVRATSYRSWVREFAGNI